MCLFLMFKKSTNGIHLLLLCEMSWCSLYTACFLIASYFSAISLIICALPLLILAAADCGIWLLALTYYNYTTKDNALALSDKSTKFLFRANRLLKNNYFIK